MKTIAKIIICIFLLFGLEAIQAKEPRTERKVLTMNTDWAFYRGDVPNGQQVVLDDADWIPAVIPHIMRLEKKHCGGNDVYDGIGWYRRYFKVDPDFRGKKVYISFEGVMTSCHVFINGKEVVNHYGGYVGFQADVTDYLNWEGDNVLAVRVSAEYDPVTPPGKPQDKMDFYYYSGIYRDVEMIVTDKLHITNAVDAGITAGGGVFVTYPEVSKEKSCVHVKTHVKNEYSKQINGKLRTVLIDANGKAVSSQLADIQLDGSHDIHIEQDLWVKDPTLWHPYLPYRYLLKSQLMIGDKVVDESVNRIGIRTIKQTADDGFMINGELLYLRGANRHQSYPNVGDAASNSMQEREVIDLKRGGYNAVRAAHYPQDPAFLDACDKYGLLVLECIPGWQYFNNDSVFIQRLYDVAHKMIRRDRNHPSVFLWEMALNESRYPVSLAKELFDIAHAEYPGDQMYTSGDYFGSADMADYFDVLYKQVGKFPKDGDVMSNYEEDLLALKPLYTREWGDGVGEKPRVSLLENEEEQMKQCRSRFFQLNGHGYFDWCMLDANDRMAGHFVWSYNDYARGCCEETLFCGVVDINRYPKFSYYMLQSMRDKQICQKGLYEGPMVHIASYNASPEYTSSTTDITVFSNCDEVKLYRNGKLIGKQTRDERTPLYAPIVKKGGSPCFIFDAGNYEKGELKAEALINNKVVAVHKVSTPEEPHHVEIEIPDNNIMPIADGCDMIPVYIKVCDKNGTLIPNSEAFVDITVQGEGTLIGENIDRIGISKQRVEGGVGFVFVRTSKKSGKIIVKAQSVGLQPANETIRTKPFKGVHVADGQHKPFMGKEEDGIQTGTEKGLTAIVSSKPIIPIEKVDAKNSQSNYPVSNLIDGNDKTWWISSEDALPQVIVIRLDKPAFVYASRILFQKDSSSYKHIVETSTDGETWDVLYERECTGWDFKPMLVNKELKYLRITIKGVSEGRAGLGEVTLFGK